MEEKKVIQISVSTLFLILSLIAIIVMGIFMYKFYNEKTEATKKSANLQTQVNSLNETIHNLQEKINTISDTINLNVDTEVKSTAKLKFDEDGYMCPTSYYGDNPEETNSWNYATFIFRENGKVEYTDFQTVLRGTYTIVNDKIECDFQEFELEHADNAKGEFDKDITLTLISDDKIIGSTLEKSENSEDEVSEFYWGMQKVVYEFQSL